MKEFKVPNKLWKCVHAMIQGLRHEWVRVEMCEYAKYDEKEDVCYGCAATNAVCEIMNQRPDPQYISGSGFKWSGSRDAIINNFEIAINDLRVGDIDQFVQWIAMAEGPEYTRIDYPHKLPYLDTRNYLEQLHEYEKFRDWLKERDL